MKCPGSAAAWAAPSIAGRGTMPDLDRIMATSDQVPADFRGRIGPRAGIEPRLRQSTGSQVRRKPAGFRFERYSTNPGMQHELERNAIVGDRDNPARRIRRSRVRTADAGTGAGGAPRANQHRLYRGNHRHGPAP